MRSILPGLGIQTTADLTRMMENLIDACLHSREKQTISAI